MALSARPQSRNRRFQLRATLREEKNSSRWPRNGAGSTSRTFILGAAREKAEASLADQTHFVVDSRQWKRFMAALDRPPRVIPQIRKLFTGRPIAESR
jgi:uncharacterized protein (DUF1778 family)